jgi:ketosteroid isomerase-like protein
MSATDETAEMRLLHEAWDALGQGDLAVLEGALAAGARWRAVEDGPWNCESRNEIIEVMSRNFADGRLRGEIEEMSQSGVQVLVGFRLQRPMEERPLDRGIAYMVVTFEDGEVVEMKGCADRAAATAYMAA